MRADEMRAVAAQRGYLIALVLRFAVKDPDGLASPRAGLDAREAEVLDSALACHKTKTGRAST
jgi:hypothetical protein